MDIDRHKRNVKRMVDAGAPETDIDKYLADEGVSLDMLRGSAAQQPADIPERGSPEYNTRMAELQTNMDAAQADSDAAQRKLDVLNPVLGGLNAVQRFTNSATLGVPDRLASTILEGKDMLTGDNNEGGPSRHAQLKAQKEQLRQQFPKSSLTADVGGAVAGLGKAYKAGVTFTKAVPGTLSKGKKFLANTAGLSADGAVIAGTTSLIDGNSAGQALQDAKEGALFTGAGNVALQGAGRALRPLLSKVNTDTPIKALKNLRTTAYKRLDSMGVRYAPESTAALRQGVADDLVNDTVGLDKAIHPATSRIVKTLSDFKGDMPFTKLEQLRKRAARIAVNPNGGEDAYAASILARNIDEFVASAPRTASQTGKSGDDVAAAVKDARELHRRVKGHESVSEAAEKAVRRGGGSTGSGGNLDNAIRQNIRQILDNPKRVKFFNQAERKAMEKVVMGSKGGNVARLLGKAAPTGNVRAVLSGTAGAGLGGALGIGGPLGVVGILGGGHISRKLSEKITQGHLDDLLHLLRNGDVPKRVNNAAGDFVEKATPVAALSAAPMAVE